MPISMGNFSWQSLTTAVLMMAVALAACSSATPAPPTVATTSSSGPVANGSPSASTGSTPVSGAAGGAGNGTLQSALDRLNKATSFHFVFTINGQNPVEGDSAGMHGNFHFTAAGGEWLVIAGSKSAIYKNQGGKWVVSTDLTGLSHITVLALIGHDVNLNPTVWQASGTQKIGGQDADYYVSSGPHGVNLEKEEAWVGTSSGDIVQLQETVTIKSNGAVFTVTLLTISNVDQPVTIPSPS